jgi:hypothetical protein
MSNKTVFVKVRITPEERERLRTAGVPMSKLIRRLLNGYFLKQRKKNKQHGK